ncbi:serine hydrolase domain-containing protein [Lactobacillus xujianguonis]|uniref:serine hydrolase domain-containing protein n=1 Tax=Lactobacillus xujianguonis TaxID=2495899 RepID=UPI000FD7D1B9|nr:serine hydrolase [Lactobacillus xujianguonis]RVU77505.1 class C beta-lactamase-related serine hydrolase [Lactobacillus xujianguonis]
MSNWNKISDVINEEIEAKSLAGAAVYAVQNGQEKLNQGYGKDRKDAIYRLYSMTKVATAVVIFKLVEMGKIALDANIGDYIPSWKHHRIFDKNKNIVPAKEITIQELLNMQSGMPYPGDNQFGPNQTKLFEQEIELEMKENSNLTTLDIVTKAGNLPGDFEPGTNWQYGISADILAGVIEAVTGKRAYEVYQELVFKPLTMNDTDFRVPTDKLKRVSVLTKRDPNYQYVTEYERPALTTPRTDTMTLPLVDSVDTVEPYFCAGGGGLYSTVQDYAKLMLMLLNKGELNGVRILKPETVEFMTTPQMTEEMYEKMHQDPVGHGVPGYAYSNLLRILVKPEEARILGVNGNVGEFGWDAAGGAFCLADPTTKTVMVYMQQDLSGAEPILRRKIYSALMEEE